MQIPLGLLNSSVHHQSAICHANDECAFIIPASLHKKELHSGGVHVKKYTNTVVNLNIEQLSRVSISSNLCFILYCSEGDCLFHTSYSTCERIVLN